MSYEDRVKNEVNCYNQPAVTRDFAWGLAKEADKEIADLKMEIEADDRNVNNLMDQVDSLGKKLQIQRKLVEGLDEIIELKKQRARS